MRPALTLAVAARCRPGDGLGRLRRRSHSCRQCRAQAVSFTPANIGKETGIFAEHGLDLEIAGFGGDAKLQQAMAADAVDIGLGSGPGMAFIVKGSPVKGTQPWRDRR